MIKSILFGISLLFTAVAFSQFGNSPEYVAGDGLTTYSSMDPLNMNTFAPKAQCGTVTRFNRYKDGQVLSTPNNQTCQWIIRDGNSGTTHFISQSQWNSAVGNTYQLPGSNIQVTVNAINSTFIELLIERIDVNDCNTSVIGLSFQHSGSSGSNSLNMLEHTCTDDCSSGGGGTVLCPVDTEQLTCCGMHCIKLTKQGTSSSCTNCYCVKVNFTDGTIASFDASFSQGDEIMHCYDKPIASYIYYAKPNFECNNCSKFSTKLAIDENPTDLIITPNPAVGSFSLRGDDLETISSVTILDNSGKEIKTFDQQSTYDIKELPVGNYVVVVLYKEAQTKVLRLVTE